MVDSRCAITVLPTVKVEMAFCTSLILWVDIDGASSKMTTGAFFSMARAMAIRWLHRRKDGTGSADNRIIAIIHLADKSVAYFVWRACSTSASVALGLPMRIFSRILRLNR